MNNNEVKEEEYWEIIERQEQQLLQLKAENEQLERRNDNLCLKVTELAIENGQLTQKLEKARELEDIICNIADEGQEIIKQHNDYNGRIYGLGYLQDIKDKIYYHQQALKELE